MPAKNRSSADAQSKPLVNPLADHIGYAIRRAQMTVFQDFCASMAAVKLRPSEYSVLAIVNRYPALRQNSLAEMLAIKPANCTALITKLERRGLLKREKLPVSGRAIALRLSSRGQALLRQAERIVNHHRRRMENKIGARGVRKLLSLLNSLYDDGLASNRSR
jgi:DNA-binding MarR family transcriptional regulator